MTVLDDIRPPGYDVLFRVGDTLTRTLTWPAGALTGRTFTASLGAVTPTVSVNGDVMTISCTASQTTTLGEGAHAFALTETTGGLTDELIVGTWVGSDRPNQNGSTSTTVTVDDGTVTVDVSGQAGLTAHQIHTLDDGTHGVVERNWAQDSTTGLTRTVMTQDGTNAFSAAVASGWLQFSAATADGNHREAWRIADTEWTDSEILSMLGTSDTFVVGNLCQWGHLHRVVQDDADPNLWHAFAVWTDIVFAAPPILNVAVVTFDGTTLNSNAGPTSGDGNLNIVLREVPVVRAQRTSNVVTCHTTVPWVPGVGDTGTLAGMANTAFNASGVAVTASNPTRRTFAFAQTAANATDADAGGLWTPAAPKSTLPYMLGTRLVGNTLLAKQWKPEEPEPDWADPLRVDTFTFSTGSPAPHSGLGVCALWVAHLETGNTMRFGGLRARKLA